MARSRSRERSYRSSTYDRTKRDYRRSRSPLKRSRSRSPVRRDRSPRRDYSKRERSNSPKRDYSKRERSNSPKRDYSKRERSNSPKRDYSKRERSNSPKRDFSKRERSNSPKRDYSKRERSNSPRRNYSPKREEMVAKEKKENEKMVEVEKHDDLQAQINSLANAARIKAAQLQMDKPVFYTKAQREDMALKRMEEKRLETLQAQEAERKERLHDLSAAVSKPVTSSSASWKNAKVEEKTVKVDKNERLKEKEIELIKQKYLNLATKKKPVVKQSDKMKIVFDWSNEDDTSVDYNPLYAKKADIALGFGRAYLGGIDKTSQHKSHSFYNDLLKEREQNGFKMDARVEEERREKADRRLDYEKKRDETRSLVNRHWSEKPLHEMAERDWRIFKEDFNIFTRGTNIPNPLRSWAEAGLPESINRALAKAGYKDPSPIQRQAIPIGLLNRDIVGIAETGSGKTCAFLVPMLVYILKLPPLNTETALDGPYSIVLAPTRELAIQIHDECRKFGDFTRTRCQSVVGGLSIEDQAMLLRSGCEVLVGTPGRIGDLIRSRFLVLNQCNYMVLDEADRMIDMGFEAQVTEIMEAMPSSNLRPLNPEEENKNQRYRQTIMFSATMPPQVELMTKTYLRNPAFVSIGDRHMKAVDRIDQRVEFVKENEKMGKLLAILAEEEPPIIIFCNAKKMCDVLAKRVEEQGYRCSVMHGDKSQDQRQEALSGFKTDQQDDRKYDILIATDVAGRGIDIKGVTHVINYEMPTKIENYAHRIGRTGRAGMSGIATSFLTATDTDIMFDLKEFLLSNKQVVPNELMSHEAAQTKPGSVLQGPPKKATKYAP